MSRDNLSYSTMDPPFFQENRSNPQSFRHEDLMDIDASWMENIDPLLDAQVEFPDFDCQQDLQQQPLQRFITEPGRALFTAGPTMSRFDSVSRTVPRTFEPVGVFPRASRTRMISPSPSQELSSNCSSAQSPGAEAEWYHDVCYSSQGQDDYILPNTIHTTPTQHFSDIWTQPHTHPTQPTGYPCVNLSDVQGFADPQEIKFEADEAYTDMEMRTDYAIQASESGGHKLASHSLHYRDEGLGASIRDVASPPRAISAQASNNDCISTTSDADADVDAEGEVDVDVDVDVDTNAEVDIEAEIGSELLHPDVDIEEEEEASDTEYTPHPSIRNPRKRTSATKSISPPYTKRHRISKPSPTLKHSSKIPSGSLTCKQCSESGFKDNSTLQRHIASAHTRAFICVFDFAGCSSTFASKNEWKRHVSSQHLNLQAWVCTLGACGKVPLSSHSGSMISKKESAMVKTGMARGEVKGAEFNRKDLFTQHLRRMHAPFEVKRKGKRNLEWEERVRGLQRSCERVRREAPERLGCPVGGCKGKNGAGAWFEGRSCWDERMEHLGRHLERAGERVSVSVSVGGLGDVGVGVVVGVGVGGGERRVCIGSTGTAASEHKIRQEDDPLFVEWAVREKIIERGGRGEWTLCVGTTGHGWARKRNGGAGASGSGSGSVGGSATGSMSMSMSISADMCMGIKVEGEGDEDLDAEGEDE
ncbi:hypothetical protein SBOR_9040 [Sclerotinia borealis F-4128]|uniref:C2H2-type domain-containing protein n=1 Tax=Sclerotinia borealis (strain F-4128) TaxID=1432307 RepID=W9C197_SCLBF|nr:hypothetical protein SBOR_9040 [Sclerotinia borealis F-4128]